MLEHLLERNPENTYSALVRNSHGASSENLSQIRNKAEIEFCDLVDFDSTSKLIMRLSPDQVYHFASNANVLESFQEPVNILKNNIMGTTHLLEACRLQHNKPRILMCSTSEVYGQVRPSETPIKETNALRPASPYAISKTTQDLLSGVYWQAYGLPIIRSRMFTYINPRRQNLFATSFATQVVKIEMGQLEVLRHGNLDSVRTHMDIRDVMSAYEELMEKGLPGEVYNLGGTESFSVGEFLEILKSKAKCEIKTLLDKSLLRPVDVTLQIPDVSKFESTTSWRPKYTLDESIDFLLESIREKLSKA